MTRKQQTRTFSVLLMATLFQFFFSQPKTTCQNAKILYRAKEILKVDARLIYIVSSWKKEKKKNHVISKVTPKVCMLFKTAVYDGSWDKRDETVLNTLLTRCWLKKKKKKKKKETNRKIMNQKRSPFQASMTLGWTFEWYCHSSADTQKESIFLPIYNMIHQGRNLP